MVKFYLTLFTLMNLAGAICAITTSTVTFSSEEGSSKSSLVSTWVGKECLGASTFQLFVEEGFTDDSIEAKYMFTSLQGSGEFYTKCDEDSAIYTKVDFFEFLDQDNAKAVEFNSDKLGKNVSVATTVEASIIKSKCAVTLPYYFYECTVSEVKTRRVTIDTILKVAPGTDKFVTKETRSTSGPGFITNFKSKSTCQDAVAAKYVITIGSTPVNIPTKKPSVASICVSDSGFVERTTFE